MPSFNPIPAGGGDWDPLAFFADNPKGIGLRLFKFFEIFKLTHGPHFRLESGLLYLLSKSSGTSGILPECLILPLPD